MVAAALPAETPYDIFLSHAYCDRERIAEARDQIMKEGYTVYVDWIEDADLERASADRRTAERLRRRMRRCGTLFYAVSSRAKISRWMPWELGYGDAWTGRVFVYPLDPQAGDYAKQVEFLMLYPVVVDIAALDLGVDDCLMRESTAAPDTISRRASTSAGVKSVR